MKIEVSKRDIQDGLPLNSQLCALASAIRRQVPGAKLHPVSVSPAGVKCCDQVYPIPDKARRFVKRFDMLPDSYRVRMRPFAFELPIAASTSTRRKT